MKRGIRIVWPKGEAVDFIPPDRKVFMVWHDQFGTAHAAGFNVDDDSEAFNKAVADVVFDVFGDRPPVEELAR